MEFNPAILRDVSTVDTSREVLGKRVGAAVRHRADRLHPDDADRGRDRRRDGRGRRGHPVLAVDDGHHVDRGRRRGRPGAAATGSSSTCGRTATGRWRWSTGPRRPATTRSLVTVDVPVAGARLRDVRNGMTIPPTLTPAHGRQRDPAAGLVDQLPHHRAAGVRLARLLVGHGRRPAGHDVRPDRDLRRPRLDPRPVAGQGRRSRACRPSTTPQRLADARRRRDRAVQPRRPPARPGAGPVPPAARRSSTRSASDLEVHLDTGIMSGQDIVAAIAHGAHFTLIGRAYLYGLMAGGRDGVDRTIEILRGQIERTMRLLGVTTPRRARARPRHPAATTRPAAVRVGTRLRGPRAGRAGRPRRGSGTPRMSGFTIMPSRISMARRIVSSSSHASGPPRIVGRYGINASLISQVAEFHR